MKFSTTVSEETRQQVVKDLPEIEEIQDEDLRARVIEAWGMALGNSSYNSLKDMPPSGGPGVLVQKMGDQTDHHRMVTRLALRFADEFKARFPDIPIDRDILLAGCLCHDIGKCWEFDPENWKRWESSGHRTGKPSVRHPAFGAHICLLAGLPEAVVHMASAHSKEGELVQRSLENTILHAVDDPYWQVLAVAGMIEPETIPPGF